MIKRHLKRQLNLAQVVMLGTAGAIGAELFVLTGHAAGISGPAAILAFFIGGVISYSIAINYCEMGTAFPVTGGAMTYVREAFGNNLLSFLVGSMDCISSVFYATLSAVGFAYSLAVFIPALPIIPTAIGILLLFTLLNVFGVTQVGNVQIVLGVLLLLLFAIYFFTGFASPSGFQLKTFMPDSRFFIGSGLWQNIYLILRTIALIYVAFVGFEVIADDAEEIKNPNKVLPQGILISLTLVIVINVAAVLVTMGNVPWQELAKSQTPLTDAVQHFLPSFGVPLMGFAGLIATLTTINSSMLSATREAFTLSRDGVWPKTLSRLSWFRTPYVAIIFVGVAACFISLLGAVDFLSFISSSGYLFVLFCASLAMIRLRKIYPNMPRPFRAPLFPLTAYIAAGLCFIIIAFTDWKALVFGAGVLAVFAIFYYGRKILQKNALIKAGERATPEQRILVAIANPSTVTNRIRLAGMIARASANTTLCAFSVLTPPEKMSAGLTDQFMAQKRNEQRKALHHVLQSFDEADVPVFSKLSIANSVTQGLLTEIKRYGNIKLLLMGLPSNMEPDSLSNNVVNEMLISAKTNVAVFLDRGFTSLSPILVPVSDGPNSKLALRLALELALPGKYPVRILHIVLPGKEIDDFEDELLQLRESIETEIGFVPSEVAFCVIQAKSVLEGILSETRSTQCGLLVMGSSDEWERRDRLFGEIDDQVILNVPCSVLVARHYESTPIAWMRRQMERLNGKHDH